MCIIRTKGNPEPVNPKPVNGVILFVTTHVVRLKQFRLEAEGDKRAQLPYNGGNV